MVMTKTMSIAIVYNNNDFDDLLDKTEKKEVIIRRKWWKFRLMFWYYEWKGGVSKDLFLYIYLYISYYLYMKRYQVTFYTLRV